MDENICLMKHSSKDYRVRAKTYEINSVDVHWHDFYEIELVLSGKGTHIVNNTEYEWKKGEMHFLRLTDFHSIKLSEPASVHLIQIPSCAIPEDIVKEVSPISGNIVAYLPEKDFEYISMLCKMLESKLSSDEIYNEIIVNDILRLVVDCLIDFMNLSWNVSDSSIENRISTIVMYMNEHFTEDLNLDKIAHRFYMSKSHLCYYFKNCMGTTVLKYIKDLRLAHAAKLIMTTQKKSIDICLECGYTSVSNFLRDFKKKYGVSPMTMRE